LLVKDLNPFMKPSKTHFNYIGMLLISLFAWFYVASSSAQEFPVKPIKIIVGSVPGGSPDFIARALAQSLSELIKLPVVVENRPGAGNTTAAINVGKAVPDGYTLYLGDTSHQADVVLKDLLPISSITSEPLLLVASNKSGFNSLQDVIREARAHPGEINFGSSGIGSIHHIAMAAFNHEVGLNITHVPYKGSGESVPAILAGDISILMTSYTATASQIKAGTLKLIAVSSSKRFSKFPNVVSMGELIKDFNYTSETGILTTNGVPAPIHQKLISMIKRVSEDSFFVAKFKDTALSINFVPFPEFKQDLQKELQKYRDVTSLMNSQ